MTQQFVVGEALKLNTCDCEGHLQAIRAAQVKQERTLQELRIASAPVLVREERLAVNYLD